MGWVVTLWGCCQHPPPESAAQVRSNIEHVLESQRKASDEQCSVLQRVS